MPLLAGVASRLPSRVWIALTLVLCPLEAFAQPSPPAPPRNFFTDTTSVVPADVAARIEQRLREFEKTSSNQVLVVVAGRVPAGYASLEEYTNRTAQAWRVGDKSRDNGAIVFVFVGDRKVRIEVGYGLEGALPDALASRIINDTITPRFRAGMYGEGILAGVEAIIGATRGEYRPAPWNQAAPSRQPPPGFFLLVVTAFLCFLLLAFIVFRAFFFSSALDRVLKPLETLHRALDPRTYPVRGSSGRETSRSWGSSTRGWSGGGSSGRGGGGFSGGGGSFGGGGASGSW